MYHKYRNASKNANCKPPVPIFEKLTMSMVVPSVDFPKFFKKKKIRRKMPYQIIINYRLCMKSFINIGQEGN